MLSCVSSSYMLDISPFSVTSFADIFSYSVGCLLVLLMVSIVVQELLSLIRSHLFIFSFISCTLGDRLKKILLGFMSKSVLLIFSSWSSLFLVLHLIHFNFIFEPGVKRMFWFHSFTLSCLIFPAPLTEDTLFSPLYTLASFVEINWP